jgi:hypothetical protein
MNADGSGISPIPALNRVRAADPLSWLSASGR